MRYRQEAPQIVSKLFKRGDCVLIVLDHIGQPIVESGETAYITSKGTPQFASG